MADFDVLQRLDTKEYKIIEINPRVPASLRAAAISGVNFPDIILRDTIGDVIPEYTYAPGKVLRYLGIDIMWLLKSTNRFHSKPFWLDFFGKNIYYQDIYKQDLSTWWTWLAVGLGKISKKNKKLR
jgi:predicted ATP-grasp superfamily ATP-dependent carboligase